ncbi:MAG: hypothetical protein ACTIKK_10175 [Agrococcus casei]|uniref:Lipoprotein n=1 Tax=Agrococcus casei LMG 22410 TaxID=1255656 RepID=A0A1R4F9E2_9MICO|nr:hypothetical protein [Agrococcus casei]SJM52529.1 hypothetical protein CZ674_03250 [Agrococcus casei LMG 22410]
MASRLALSSLLLMLTLGAAGCTPTPEDDGVDTSPSDTAAGDDTTQTDAAEEPLHEWRFEEGMHWVYDVEPLHEGESLPEGAFDEMRWEVLSVEGDTVRMERTYYIGGEVSETEQYDYVPAADGSLSYSTNEDFAAAFGVPGEIEPLEQEDWEVPALQGQTEPVAWQGVNLYADVDDESMQYGYRAAFEREPPQAETIDVLGEPMEALCYETHVAWHWQYGPAGEQEFEQKLRECTVMGMGNVTTELTTVDMPQDVATLTTLTETNALEGGQ